MKYRSTEGEEESGSDWDDLTPKTTPRYTYSFAQPEAQTQDLVAKSSSSHNTITSTITASSDQTQVPNRKFNTYPTSSSKVSTTTSHKNSLKETDTPFDGIQQDVELTSIAIADSPHPPPPKTPSSAKSIYRVEGVQDSYVEKGHVQVMVGGNSEEKGEGKEVDQEGGGVGDVTATINNGNHRLVVYMFIRVYYT